LANFGQPAIVCGHQLSKVSKEQHSDEEPKEGRGHEKNAMKRKTTHLAPEPKRIVRWKDIARAAFMLGVVSDFSKGDASASWQAQGIEGRGASRARPVPHPQARRIKGNGCALSRLLDSIQHLPT
jgi:hypothetical protein